MKRLILVACMVLASAGAAAAQQTVTWVNCSGVNDTAAFQSIITGAAGAARTIHVPYKPNTAQRCALNTITIPSNITIENTDGSGIKVNSGQTVTLNGPYANQTGKTLFFGPGTAIVNGSAISGDPCLVQLPGVAVVTCPPYSADNTGATDASAALRSAVAAGAKKIYLPTGTYLFSQSSITSNPSLVQLTAPGVEIFGDGPGLTIIKTPSSITIATATMLIDFLGAPNGSVHDIWFQGPSTVSGASSVIGIAARFGSYRPHLYNLKFTNLNDNTTAGMAAISLYNPWNQAEYVTTLGTNIAAGTRTVTPGSMSGIYIGRILAIGGTTENVTVTATTATTFTAVFANAHNNTDSVGSVDDAYQGALVENVEVKDSYKATALVVNSTSNIIRNFKAINVGDPNLGTQHGFYVQAGNNFFDGFLLQGIGGYGIHQFLTAGGVTPASGNVYSNGQVIDAGTMVLIGANDTSSSTNPYYPSGLPLNRYTTIANCLFRNTYAAGVFSNIHLAAPTYFDGNVLEDVTGFQNDSPYTIITSNNVSRKIFVSGTVAALTATIGGGTKMFNALPESRVVAGHSAYPAATGANRTGGNLDLIPGWGSHLFTALDNLSGAVVLTITVLPSDGFNNFTLTSGVDFNLGSSNSGAQLAVTATNLANAINTSTNVGQYIRAEASGPNVYLVRMPAVGSGLAGPIYDAIISSNQGGRISATSNNVGAIQTYGAIVQTAVVTFTDLDATPSVAGANRFNASNTGATSITNFTNGVDGQRITVRFTTGNTTIVQGTTINNQTGANVTPAVNTIKSYERFSGVWYEQ